MHTDKEKTANPSVSIRVHQWFPPNYLYVEQSFDTVTLNPIYLEILKLNVRISR